MVARSENVATRKLKNAFEINAAFFTFRVFRQVLSDATASHYPSEAGSESAATNGAP